MNDVPISEPSVLAAQEARVLLVDEQAEVRAQPAMLVAHSLGQRWVRLHQCLKGLAERRCVERYVACPTREATVGAVKKYPHMSTTNGSGQDIQASEDDGRDASAGARARRGSR